MTPQQRIERLEADIRQFQIEYEKFFSGGRNLPPEDLQEKLRVEVRALRNMTLRSLADSWRLGQVEARLASYSELFGRRLRLQEEGRGPAVPVVQRHPSHDPHKGIDCADVVEPEAAEALYRGLVGGRPGGPDFDLDSFKGYLQRQVEAIRSRTGCTGVRFRLEREGDGMKLKARPIKDPRPAKQSPGSSLSSRKE